MLLDLKSITAANDMIDRFYAHAEEGVGKMRLAGFDAMADEFEREFLAQHDKLMREVAKLIDAAKREDIPAFRTQNLRCVEETRLFRDIINTAVLEYVTTRLGDNRA